MATKSRHTYEYDVNLQDNTAPARVVRMIENGSRVLEVGAGPGSITKNLRGPKSCHVTALEIDESAIEKLAPFCDEVIQADLNDSTWIDSLQQKAGFDAIIAADVLEHIYNPWETLGMMKTLLNDTGHIVISLPHTGHSAIMACLMQNDFDYRDCGLLDRTHIRFFGIKNIQTLFEGAGLKIVDAQFVIVQPEDSEFAEHWSQLTNLSKEMLLSCPYSLVYQVVIKAVPDDRADEHLNLMSQPAERRPFETKISDLELMRRLARSMLSPDSRAKLRGVFKSIGVKV